MARKSKTQSLRVHARKRARERLGFELTEELRKFVIAQIRAGIAKLLEKQSLRVSVYEIILPIDRAKPTIGEDFSTSVRIVYDKKRNEVVTVLP